jgi:spore coat protein U-like protein
MCPAAMSGLLRRVAPLVCAWCAIMAWSSRAEAAPNCTISTTSVSFGSYDVFSSTPTDSTGTVSYRCSGNAPSVLITLNKGSSATFNPRTLKSGANVLTYNLFTDAARTSIWGDGTGSTTFYQKSPPPNNTMVNVTVYGRIPAAQDVGASPSYTDSVTATINF